MEDKIIVDLKDICIKCCGLLFLGGDLMYFVNLLVVL